MSRRTNRMATATMIVALSFFCLVYGFAFPTAALAWDNCPKGLVNDPFPGECRRYEDTNGDGICDLSQPRPTAATTTTEVVASTTTTTKVAAATTTLAPTAATSGEPPTGDCPLGPCLGCGACFGVPVVAATASIDSAGEGTVASEVAVIAGAATAAAVSESSNTTTTTPSSGGSDSSATISNDSVAVSTSGDSGGSSLMTHYMVSPIAIAFFLIYGVSFVLYKTKRMRIATHRKIWNVLLAATFLITGIFGLILTVQLDYELPFRIPFDLLFWHVEAGIAMTLISLFHLGWHFNYYRNLLRSSRSKVRAARGAERARTAVAGQLVATDSMTAATGSPIEAREQRRLERETRRSAAAARGIAAQRAIAEPERAARGPHPRTEFEAE